jgi:Asp-tRNA(Asn)/Glu-tRNA(Gln) amidotransferase A subunit family amidase
MGCIVEEAMPDFSMEALWRAFLPLRAWQTAGPLLAHYRDPARRALLKDSAIFEVESALKLSALDITAASAVRAEWYQATRRFFERYDFFIVPTAQVFPYDANIDWPKEIAGVNGDLSRMAEGRDPDHHGRQPGAGRAGRLQRHWVADGNPDRRPQSRRDGVPAARAGL